MSEEIELKLALAPEALAKLRQHPLLRTLATGRERRQRVVSTYFDTPDLFLKQRQMALRLREIGRRRVQGLKVASGAAGGCTAALQHQEFEQEVAGDRPELAAIEDPALRRLFAQRRLAETLGPVFVTDFERRTLPLRLGETVIELALDRGEIRAGSGQSSLCEAELELKSGNPRRLFELALALSEDVPFRLERATKAARGYALRTPGEAGAVKGRRPALVPGMTVAEAFTTSARACLEQLRGNETSVLQGRDPEGVHQMRVALRRLRALLSLFRPAIAPEMLAEVREELRWLQQKLGGARDWDVFAIDCARALRARLPEDATARELEAAAEAARGTAYRVAQAALLDRRYTRLLLRLDLWLSDGGWRDQAGEGEAESEKPIVPYATRLLEGRARKLTKKGEDHQSLDEAELHALRIEAKKLRYAIEFFGDLFPRKAVRAYHEHLVGLQDLLGIVNDVTTARALLEQLAAPVSRSRHRRGLSKGALRLAQGWLAARATAAIEGFTAAWEDYRKAEPFWAKR